MEPVFKSKEIDENPTHKIAAFQPKIEMYDYRTPTTEDFNDYIPHLRHSAPGPDGLQYWAAAGEEGARTLLEVTLAMMRGEEPPADFCSSFLEAPPKVTKTEDTEPTSF